MANMPKVVYILPFYSEHTDTHLFYNYELIRSLAGVLDIFVVIEKAALSEGEVNLGAPYRIQSRGRGIFRLLELFLILRSLRRRGYDNFYVHYSYYGALAARLVTLFLGGGVWYWNRGLPWLYPRDFFSERLFRFLLRHTILVTSPESLAKEYVRRYGVKQYKVLSNWIDVERFLPKESKDATKRWFGLRGEDKIILFVHHLSLRKGADLIIKIALGFEDPRLHFFVIGRGPYEKTIERESMESKVPMKLFGQVPNQDLAPYFQAAEVFMLPSREEGSPHVILEAMAAGTPFVASEVGGIREIIPPGCEEFLCPVADTRCFQEKIKKLLSDAALYEKSRAQGLLFVKNFGKEKAVKEFANLFGA